MTTDGSQPAGGGEVDGIPKVDAEAVRLALATGAMSDPLLSDRTKVKLVLAAAMPVLAAPPRSLDPIPEGVCPGCNGVPAGGGEKWCQKCIDEGNAAFPPEAFLPEPGRITDEKWEKLKADYKAAAERERLSPRSGQSPGAAILDVINRWAAVPYPEYLAGRILAAVTPLIRAAERQRLLRAATEGLTVKDRRAYIVAADQLEGDDR